VFWRIHLFGQGTHSLPPRPLPAIVLGARVFEDGTPSQALADRVHVGIELWNRGAASSLTFTGGSPDARPSEAHVMARLAREAGVPAEQCRLECESLSTFDNARFCAAQLREREVLLVTCDFHLYRACAQFRAQGFTVWPVASRRRLSRVDRVKVTALEVSAMLRRPSLW
jgi:SanA protein